MRSRTTHRRGRGPRRKFDDYAVSHTFAGANSTVSEIFDVMNQFKTDYGAKPYQATLSIPRFDLVTVGTGAGTNVNSVTLGFIVAPNTMTAPELDPVANPRNFWWTRKYYVQNNSNPPGVPWAIQGVDALDWTVRTRRTIKALDHTLFMVVRPDFTGFTALATTVNLHVGILYA